MGNNGDIDRTNAQKQIGTGIETETGTGGQTGTNIETGT